MDKNTEESIKLENNSETITSPENSTIVTVTTEVSMEINNEVKEDEIKISSSTEINNEVAKTESTVVHHESKNMDIDTTSTTDVITTELSITTSVVQPISTPIIIPATLPTKQISTTIPDSIKNSLLNDFLDQKLMNIPNMVNNAFQIIKDTDIALNDDFRMLNIAREVFIRHIRECSYNPFINNLSFEQLESIQLSSFSAPILYRQVLFVFKELYPTIHPDIIPLMEKFKDALSSQDLNAISLTKRKFEGTEPEFKAYLSNYKLDDSNPADPFELAYFNPESKSIFSPYELCKLDSSGLSALLGSEELMNKQTSKFKLVDDTYKVVDICIQEFDHKTKEYEEKLRSLIGFDLNREDVAASTRHNKKAIDSLYNKYYYQDKNKAAKLELNKEEALQVLNTGKKKDRKKALEALENSVIDKNKSNAAISFGDTDYDLPVDANEPVYCTCRKPAYGEMIACDNEECPNEWFHLPCVKLNKLPPSSHKWYCPECKKIFTPGK